MNSAAALHTGYCTAAPSPPKKRRDRCRSLGSSHTLPLCRAASAAPRRAPAVERAYHMPGAMTWPGRRPWYPALGSPRTCPGEAFPTGCGSAPALEVAVQPAGPSAGTTSLTMCRTCSRTSSRTGAPRASAPASSLLPPTGVAPAADAAATTASARRTIRQIAVARRQSASNPPRSIDTLGGIPAVAG